VRANFLIKPIVSAHANRQINRGFDVRPNSVVNTPTSIPIDSEGDGLAERVEFEPDVSAPTSAATLRFFDSSPRRLDRGDVNLLHRHHRLECTLGFGTSSGQRLGQGTRGDLPRETPAVLAPPALALLAAIADNRVPVAVRLFLCVRGNLEREGLGVRELRGR
jgi:hypothetical protein